MKLSIFIRSIIFIILSILSVHVSAQIFTRPNSSFGTIANRGSIDSTLYIPTWNAAPTDSTFLFSRGFAGQGQILKKAAIYYDSTHHQGYIWDPSTKTWGTMGSGGGSSQTADETSLHLSGSVYSIKTSWIGQTAITTLGTITTGVWNGTPITDPYILSAPTWNAKLGSSLASGHVFVGSIAGVATDVPMTGDVTISSAGATALKSVITAGSCTNCNLTYDANGRVTVANNGSGSGSGAPFADNTALVENNADHTKLVIISAASVPTATTETLTVPPASGTIDLQNNTATLTNKTISAGSNTITGLTNTNLSGTAAISNANLSNSAITIDGTSVPLGGSIANLLRFSDTLSSIVTFTKLNNFPFPLPHTLIGIGNSSNVLGSSSSFFYDSSATYARLSGGVYLTGAQFEVGAVVNGGLWLTNNNGALQSTTFSDFVNVGSSSTCTGCVNIGDGQVGSGGGNVTVGQHSGGRGGSGSGSTIIGYKSGLFSNTQPSGGDTYTNDIFLGSFTGADGSQSNPSISNTTLIGNQINTDSSNVAIFGSNTQRVVLGSSGGVLGGNTAAMNALHNGLLGAIFFNTDSATGTKGGYVVWNGSTWVTWGTGSGSGGGGVDTGVVNQNGILKTIIGATMFLQVDSSKYVTQYQFTHSTDSVNLRTPGTGTGAIPIAYVNGGSLVIPNVAPGTGITFSVAGDSLWTINSTGFANPMTTLNDIIIGGVSGVATRLGKGSNNTLLGVNGSGSLAYTLLTNANFTGSAGITNANLANSSITINGTPVSLGGTITVSAGMTNPMTTSGDIIYGGAAGAPNRLGIGSTNQVLTIIAGIPSWQTPASGFSDPTTTNNDIIAHLAGSTTRLAGGANGTFLGVSGGVLGYYTPVGTTYTADETTVHAASNVFSIKTTYPGQSSIITVGALTSGSLAFGFTPVANSLLANSSMTLNGTSVSLGGTFSVTDANLSTSNVTTNDVSITKHGFAPILPNDATKFLNGVGGYTIPAGTYTLPTASTSVLGGVKVDGTTITISGGVISSSGGSSLATASGDASGTVSGTNLPLTLATVNSNVGSFGDATHVAQVTVNAKGLVTAASSVAITGLQATSYQTQTASGSTTFTFTSVPASFNDYMVFVNGVLIIPTTDYTTSGNVITIPGIITGDKVVFREIK